MTKQKVGLYNRLWCVIRCFGQAGRGRGAAAVARGRVGGPQARGPVRGGRNPAASGARGAQRPAARGGVVRAKGSLPGEDGLYLRDEHVSFSILCLLLYIYISILL